MHKILKNITCLAIIFILIIFNLFLYSNYNKNINIIGNLNQRVGDLEKEIEQSKNKLPEGWMEYINKKYGFKIWYPSKDSYFNTKIDLTEYYDNHQKAYIIDFSTSFNDAPTPRLAYIYIYAKSTLNIRDFIKNNIEENNNINNIDQYLTKTEVNGAEVNKVEISNDFVRYYIEKDNLIFVLRFDGYMLLREAADNLRPNFDQMVQSFGFIE